jgi:F0F1-type ATP synthase assembly protein I
MQFPPNRDCGNRRGLGRIADLFGEAFAPGRARVTLSGGGASRAQLDRSRQKRGDPRRRAATGGERGNGLGRRRVRLAAGAGGVGRGFAIAIGNLLFAVRLFGRGVMPARHALHAAYAGEVIKWFWVCAVLYAAIAVWKLPFLALFAGLVAAQLCFWIALIATR